MCMSQIFVRCERSLVLCECYFLFLLPTSRFDFCCPCAFTLTLIHEHKPSHRRTHAHRDCAFWESHVCVSILLLLCQRPLLLRMISHTPAYFHSFRVINAAYMLSVVESSALVELLTSPEPGYYIQCLVNITNETIII